MTLMFYLLTAAAIAVALFFSLKPLLGQSAEVRDLKQRIRRIESVGPDLAPDDWEQRRDGLRQQLAGADQQQTGSAVARGLVLLLLVLIPLSTIGLYQLVGAPEGLEQEASISTEFRQALGELTQRVQRQPRDIEAWMQIGAIQKQLQQYSAAEGAWRRVLYFDPDEPIALTELAETLLFASGQRSLGPESRALLEQAVAIQPDNQKALFLLGIDAFQSGDYNRALARWTALESLLPEGEARAQIRQQMARAEQAAGQSNTALAELHSGISASPIAPTDTNPSAEADQDGEAPSVVVGINVADSLLEQLNGSETLFVFARAIGGPPAPLAVQRMPIEAGQGFWPVDLTLTDADSMAPGLNLSAFEEIEVVARISTSGNAIAQPGDLEGISQPTRSAPAQVVDVLINRIVD